MPLLDAALESFTRSGKRLMEEKPFVVYGVVGPLVLIALVVAGFQFIGSEPSPLTIGKSFYTNDEGATWFVASSDKVPPFDHDGKPAYRCYVYRCRGGQPFVGHLEKFDEASKERLEDARAAGKTKDAAPAPITQAASGPMVKRPGDKEWVVMSPATSKQYVEIVKPQPKDCPAGDVESVNPE